MARDGGSLLIACHCVVEEANIMQVHRGIKPWAEANIMHYACACFRVGEVCVELRVKSEKFYNTFDLLFCTRL